MGSGNPYSGYLPEPIYEVDGVIYESCSSGKAGPSAQPFILTLRYGKLPLLNGKPIDLDSYDMFDSPYLKSAWDSGIVKLCFGPYRLTIDVTRPAPPFRAPDYSATMPLED